MNLMQYLSVGGTLEGPREKFLSRRIGNSQEGFTGGGGGELAHPEPVALIQPTAEESGQGEFGFLEPLVIEPKTSGPGNHLDLEQAEAKPRARDQVEVYSRISPTRVRVVRNDLEGSDLAVRAGECVKRVPAEPHRRGTHEELVGRAHARPVCVAEPILAICVASIVALVARVQIILAGRHHGGGIRWRAGSRLQKSD